MTEVEKEQKYEFLCNTPYNTTKSRYYLCFAKATLSLGMCILPEKKKKPSSRLYEIQNCQNSFYFSSAPNSHPLIHLLAR